MAHLTNFSFEFFYKIFTEDASLPLLYHGAKKGENDKNSNQGGPALSWNQSCQTPRFSAAGMVRMKNHEKSGSVHLIWNPGQVLTAGCRETLGRARAFISDQSKGVSQDREWRQKLHRCIQTAIDSVHRDWSSARRNRRLFFQTFHLSFVISSPILTNEPSLASLKSQQSDGAIFVPRERTIAPFLRRHSHFRLNFPESVHAAAGSICTGARSRWKTLYLSRLTRKGTLWHFTSNWEIVLQSLMLQFGNMWWRQF